MHKSIVAFAAIGLTLSWVTTAGAVQILRNGSIIFNDHFESGPAATLATDDADPVTAGWIIDEGQGQNIQVLDGGFGQPYTPSSAFQGDNFLHLAREVGGGENVTVQFAESPLTTDILSTRFMAYIPSLGVDGVSPANNPFALGFTGSTLNAFGGRTHWIGANYNAGGRDVQYYDSAWNNTGLTYQTDRWQEWLLELDLDAGTTSLTIDGATNTNPIPTLGSGALALWLTTNSGNAAIGIDAVGSGPIVPAIRTVPVFQNEGTSAYTTISKTISLPDFAADSKLLANVHVIPAGSPWDCTGWVWLVTPQGRVDLNRFITGFGGETWFSADISALAPLLKGTVQIEGRVPTWTEHWQMDFEIKEVPHANPSPAAWAEVVIPANATVSATTFSNGPLSYTVDVPEGDFDRIMLAYYATGHGTVDEFTQRRNKIMVDGVTVFDQVVWRESSTEFRSVNPFSAKWDTDGDGVIDTWSSDLARSGWLPGDDVDPFWIDLTDLLTPGHHTIAYLIEGIDPNNGSWCVGSFLSASVVVSEPSALSLVSWGLLALGFGYRKTMRRRGSSYPS